VRKLEKLRGGGIRQRAFLLRGESGTDDRPCSRRRRAWREISPNAQDQCDAEADPTRFHRGAGTRAGEYPRHGASRACARQPRQHHRFRGGLRACQAGQTTSAFGRRVWHGAGGGARINSISPGVIATPMGHLELDSPVPGHWRDLVARRPVGRLGHRTRIAAAAAFLLGQRHRSSPAPTFWSTAEW